MLRLLKNKLFNSTDNGHFLDPGFLIIGSQKCGTTSLYNYLIQHPNIIAASRKEIQYFSSNYDKGYEWYKCHFSVMKDIRGKADVITGEATPYYIIHPHSPVRVREIIPNIKLIVMLRDPVERAFSHYKHHVKHKVEPLSFIEAIKSESERLMGELDKMIQDESYNSYNLQMFSYLARGVYVDQLKRWLKYFPKEQLLILQSEEFFKNPEEHFAKALQFLNLPEYKLKSYKKYNSGQKASMDKTVREYLINYFTPFNERLYELLGLDFGWQK